MFGASFPVSLGHKSCHTGGRLHIASFFGETSLVARCWLQVRMIRRQADKQEVSLSCDQESSNFKNKVMFVYVFLFIFIGAASSQGPPRENPQRVGDIMTHFGSAIKSLVSCTCIPICSNNTEMGERVGPRLRELASRGRREPGGGIHAT